MRFSDEVLMAYADDELDAERRAELQQAIETDPEIARRVAEHAALRRSVHHAFAGVLKEPVPERLQAAVGPRVQPSLSTAHESPEVVPLRPARRGLPSLPRWAALAASFLIGAVAWQLIGRGSGSQIVERGGQLLATGALAQALSQQVVSEQTSQSPVQIGISFRSRTGNYCRTFQMQRDSYAGMACHDSAGWEVQVLGRSASASPASAAYRRAASAWPDWLAQQVDGAIAGEPMDVQAELSARARDWH